MSPNPGNRKRQKYLNWLQISVFQIIFFPKTTSLNFPIEASMNSSLIEKNSWKTLGSWYSRWRLNAPRWIKLILNLKFSIISFIFPDIGWVDFFNQLFIWQLSIYSFLLYIITYNYLKKQIAREIVFAFNQLCRVHVYLLINFGSMIIMTFEQFALRRRVKFFTHLPW